MCRSTQVNHAASSLRSRAVAEKRAGNSRRGGRLQLPRHIAVRCPPHSVSGRRGLVPGRRPCEQPRPKAGPSHHLGRAHVSAAVAARGAGARAGRGGGRRQGHERRRGAHGRQIVAAVDLGAPLVRQARSDGQRVVLCGAEGRVQAAGRLGRARGRSAACGPCKLRRRALPPPPLRGSQTSPAPRTRHAWEEHLDVLLVDLKCWATGVMEG